MEEEVIFAISEHLRQLQNLIGLAQRSSQIRRTILKLKYQRMAILRNLKRRRDQIARLCASATLMNRRTVWKYDRCGHFWEKDITMATDDQFKEFFRVDRQEFNTLVDKLQGIAKKDTVFRKCIPLPKRIAVALYTLGSSAEYRTIGRLFGISKVMVCKILKDFCLETWNVLSPEYLPANFITQEKISECVKGFEDLGFPQVFGAVDGCHIEIRPGASDATDYYNYKGWYSTILLALVDHRCRFHYINVGSPGRCNDSQIFEKSTLRRLLEGPILSSQKRTICGVDVPVMILGDSAFRLSTMLMKPYAFHTAATEHHKVFNYRLSKARIVVENAFGHLKARFRRIGKGLDNNMNNVNAILKCCCVLHNFLNCNNSLINERWVESASTQISNVDLETPNNIDGCDSTAEEIRNAITLFFQRAEEAFEDEG